MALSRIEAAARNNARPHAGPRGLVDQGQLREPGPVCARLQRSVRGVLDLARSAVAQRRANLWGDPVVAPVIGRGARPVAAWSGDGQNVEATGKPPQFPPALLDDPDIAFFAAHEGRDIAGGGIANRAEGVVGLSSVFIGAADELEIWSALAAIAGAAFPGLPLVGYERGRSLEVAASCGFTPIGPLRVWMRE